MDAELLLNIQAFSSFGLATRRCYLHHPFTVLHASTRNRKLRLGHFVPPIAAATPDISYELISKFRELAPTSPAFGERNHKYYTARDVALGLVDVFGWKVEAEGKGEVGKVAEIIHVTRSGDVKDGTVTPYEYLLKVIRPFSSAEDVGHKSWTVDTSEHFDGHFGTKEVKILIPIVNEFVRHIDPMNKTLLVTPPAGLLELAARPEAIAKLKPEIRLFCKDNADFLAERFDGKKNRPSSGNLDYHNIIYSYMPTREQMFAVGRPDLVRRIKNAGGFLYVANALGLRSTRRPNGFWDDLERLDFEIECFLLESWVQLVKEDIGEIYFYNPVTNEVMKKKPAISLKPVIKGSYKISPSGLDGGSSLKVMPRMKLIGKAGRWDLHHAIVWNGGYREVAHQLGRKMIRKSRKRLSRKQI